MPNVGKSSLLNAFRRVGMGKGTSSLHLLLMRVLRYDFQGKVAIVGPDAGVTKNLGGVIKITEDPPTYVYDTPGVFVPFLGRGPLAAERGLKLGLTGTLYHARYSKVDTKSETAGIKESIFDPETLADYLLFRINWRHFQPESYTSLEDLRANLPFLVKVVTNAT